MGPVGRRGSHSAPTAPRPGSEEGSGQPRPPSLCQMGSPGLSNITLEGRDCPGPDPRHAAPCSRALPRPGQGTPGTKQERTKPATPRRPFGATVHHAEAPLALLLG